MNGSPIPMYVTFVIFSSVLWRRRAKNTICSRISSAVRFLMSPILPVSQNVQAIGHPTWHETQIEFLDESGVDDFGFLWRMRTASTFLPSWRVMRAFVVWPSLLDCWVASIPSGQSCLSWSLSGFGRVCAWSQSSMRSLNIACLT